MNKPTSMKFCSHRLILQRASMVRLIDGSIWADLGNRKSVHQTDLTVKEIEVLYPKIETVVESKGLGLNLIVI